MTLKEMRSKVRSITGNVDEEKLPDALINDFLNEAQTIIVDEGNMLETFATLSGGTTAATPRYDLIKDLWLQEGVGSVTSLAILKIKRVDLGDYKIDRVGMNEIPLIDTTTKTAGTQFFTTDGQIFVVTA
jgi:hypothetical protein|tara:strand:+ start:1576 stop:1965 length:390 start_codon:yes stop_codon:yes gene_type:complete